MMQNPRPAAICRQMCIRDRAQEVSDLIELETAIADTQYEIERYETSQRDIDRRVDMSAVNVTLLEESPAQSATAEDLGLGERLLSLIHI